MMMQTESCLRRAVRIAIGATVMAACANAHASGFALQEQSASRLGNAFAGTAAAADDATTIFYNPAGLLELDQAELTVVASGVDIGSEFRNSNSQAALGQPLGVEGGNADGWNAVPAAYLALPVGKDLAFGFGVNVPFGLQLDYARDWMGRFQALKSEIKTYNFNPALSFRLNDHVSLGFGMNYQRVQAELTNALNYSAVVGQGLQQLVLAGQLSPAAVPGLMAANAGLEGGTVVRGDDAAWGFNAGVLFKFTESTRLGFAYRSSLKYHIEGSVRFAPPSASDPVGAGIIAAAAAPGARLANGAVAVDLELPDIATASFYQKLGERFELLADVGWTGWSSVQELRIVRDSGQLLSVTPEHWKDTWRYALGLTYRISDTWKLRGGVAFDETPVPDSTRTARLPDAERKWVAAGARWQLSDSALLDFGYAHLFSDDARINQDDGNALASGLLNGKQKSGVDIVAVQFGYRF